MTDPFEVSAAVAQMRAVDEIKALKYRYWRACDAKDPETFADCFVPRGAVIDYGPMGAFDDAAPMVEVFRRYGCARVDGGYAVLDLHHGGHPEIELTGPGAARGRWLLQFRQLNTVARTETLAVGEYDDEYVRGDDGRWRMSVCRFTQRWTHTRPLGDGEVVTEGTIPGPGSSW